MSDRCSYNVPTIQNLIPKKIKWQLIILKDTGVTTHLLCNSFMNTLVMEDLLPDPYGITLLSVLRSMNFSKTLLLHSGP